MTIADHDLVMSRSRQPHDVGIAELKAHLSEVLRSVRGGETTTVYDRGTPIACIVPYGQRGAGLMVVRAAKGDPHEVKLPPSLGHLDSLGALREEREERLDVRRSGRQPGKKTA